MKKYLVMLNLLFLLSLLFFSCEDKTKTIDPPLPPGEDTIIVDKYQAIALNLNANGGYDIDGETIEIELYGTNALYGVCLPGTAEGHFFAETTCQTVDNNSGYGIAIIQTQGGKPDYNNFTSVSVVLNEGYPYLSVSDRQNGTDNVLDNTNTINAADFGKRYSLTLNGSQYSVPFTQVNGKVRILRNDISGFFHFYVGVKKEIDGITKDDWIELAQSRDWAPKGQKYLIAPIAATRSKDKTVAKFKDTRIDAFDPSDISDVATGFEAKKRSYTWAGFKGDAVVVTFDENTGLGRDDRKFVFWSESNYVPHWHMHNELAFSYEFVEVWSNRDVNGCFEPMSDRLRRYSTVEIVENTKLRKVIKWNYVLVNPDYALPAPGDEKPEVEEIYTIYPDGTGTRVIKFRQKTDGGFRSAHELAEPMVISGSSTVPSDHFGSPALHVSNLQGAYYDLLPNRNFNADAVKAWTEQMYTVNLNNAPDPFCVFSFNTDNASTAPLAVTPEFTWHNTNFQMSHFPVDRQPYLTDYDKSLATFPSQISHSSVIGIEAFESTDWSSDYQIDTDGRKYRVYMSLIGLDENKSGIVSQHTQTWLYRGNVEMAAGYVYRGVDYSEKLFVFGKEQSGSFSAKFSDAILNPVLKISGASFSSPSVKVDNTEVNNYVIEMKGNDSYIYLPVEVNAGSTIFID